MKQSLLSCLQEVKEEAIYFEKGLKNKVEITNRSYGLILDAKEAENSLQVFRNELSKLFGNSDEKNYVYSLYMAAANEAANLPR